MSSSVSMDTMNVDLYNTQQDLPVHINMAQYSMGNKLASALALSLPHLNNVQELNLRDNRMDGATVGKVLDALALSGNGGLRKMDLGGSISPEPGKKTPTPGDSSSSSSSRQNNKHDLVELDLSRNRLTHASVLALKPFLQGKQQSLQRLTLAHSGIGDLEMRTLVDVADDSHCLTYLDLSYNRITSKGAALFATCLDKVDCYLQTLDLGWNMVSKNGAREIGKSLLYNTSLTTLHLAYNQFGVHAQVLANSLLSNTTLLDLDMANNAVSGPAAMVFADALRQNSTLHRLNLDGNPLGDSGGRAIMMAVAKLCTRRDLDAEAVNTRGKSKKKAKVPKKKPAKKGKKGVEIAAEEKKEPQHLSIQHCSYAQDNFFDRNHPSGKSPYELDMSQASHRSVVRELIMVIKERPGCAMTQVFHTQVPLGKGEESNANTGEGMSIQALRRGKKIKLNIDCSVTGNGDDGEEAHGQCICDGKPFGGEDGLKDLPQSGLLSFKFVEKFRVPTLVDAVSDQGLVEVAKLVLRGATSQEQLDLLRLASKDFFLVCDQAQLLLDMMQEGVAVDIAGDERVQAAMQMGLTIASSKRASLTKLKMSRRDSDAPMAADDIMTDEESQAYREIMFPSRRSREQRKDAQASTLRNLEESNGTSLPDVVGVSLAEGAGGEAGLKQQDGFDDDGKEANKASDKEDRIDHAKKMSQIKSVLEMLGQGSVVKGGTLAPINVISAIYPRLLDPEKSFAFVHTNLSEVDIGQLIIMTGRNMFKFNRCNPTGHWRFDLGSPSDREVLVAIFAINQQQRVNSMKKSGRNDTSQHRNWNNFRNEEFLGSDNSREKIILDSKWLAAMPPRGVLELDYVSTERPPRSQKAVPHSFIPKLLGMIGIGTNFGTAVAKEEAPAKKGARRGSSSSAGEANVEDEQAGEKHMLSTLLLNFHLLASSHYYFTCKQVITIIDKFPDHMKQARAEVAVSCFSRCVDLENWDDVIDTLPAKLSRELLNRLGFLNVWNPVKPYMPYHCSLTAKDQQVVVDTLLNLAVATEETLKEDFSRNEIPLHELYAKAVLPDAGEIYFTFVPHEDAKPAVVFQHQFSALKHVLLGTRCDPDDEEDGGKLIRPALLLKNSHTAERLSRIEYHLNHLKQEKKTEREGRDQTT